MRISTFFAIATLACLIYSCNDDDDQNDSPAPAISFPHTMQFDREEGESLELWVGGEAQSTQGITVQDLIDPDDFDEIFFSWEGLSLVFTADSLSAPGLPGANAYNFVGDSLFATLEGPLGAVQAFIGVGNLNELRIPQSAVQYCAGFENFSSCSSFGGAVTATLEQGLELGDIESLDQMGPSDSLLVYNKFMVMKAVL